jgi:hypothetical protein
MQSQACKSLNYSFVAVQIRVADSSGNLRTSTFELSIAEFKACRAHMSASPLISL